MIFPSPAEIAFKKYNWYIQGNHTHEDAYWFAGRSQGLNKLGWDALAGLIKST